MDNKQFSAHEPRFSQTNLADHGASLRIAVIGAGAVGSAFAFQLARAGHRVAMVARGNRLAQLQHDGAIVTTSGERAPVQVSAALDPTTEFDLVLVLVTVLASQVDALLPALAASAARTVMFMFNYFAPLSHLRNAVGAARFAFGFPAVLARLENGRVAAQFYRRGIRTTVSDPAWARVLTYSGVGSVVHPNIVSWRRLTRRRTTGAGTRAGGPSWRGSVPPNRTVSAPIVRPHALQVAQIASVSVDRVFRQHEVTTPRSIPMRTPSSGTEARGSRWERTRARRTDSTAGDRQPWSR
jgi:hypothetical protein